MDKLTITCATPEDAKRMANILIRARYMSMVVGSTVTYWIDEAVLPRAA